VLPSSGFAHCNANELNPGWRNARVAMKITQLARSAKAIAHRSGEV
jgi:hypothetical protein